MVLLMDIKFVRLLGDAHYYQLPPIVELNYTLMILTNSIGIRNMRGLISGT